MKIDSGLTGNLKGAPESARKLEEMGYDGVMSIETAHDPFFPLVRAAETTSRVDLLTSIAVAFSRTPMLLANIGHDLNAFSQGRFIMGLGSQIQAHITKRFSMPWSRPAARMREFIQAMNAIWDAWYDGKRLDFRGEFYTHTLMTPMFTPVDIKFGRPKVFLAAVGPLMAQVAAEVADGLIIHAFTTEKYIREVTMPAIAKGLEKSGRSRADFQVCYPGFVVTGRTEEEFATNKAAVCKQIAFYGSTPAYAPVLGIHGWGELQPELNRMSKQGQWDEMATLISDDVLDTFAVVGETDDAVARFKQRFGDIIDRTTAGFTARDDDHRRDILARLRA